jgi:hypothetical protein
LRGVCKCEDTFYGPDCGTQGCPRGTLVAGVARNCSGHGTCTDSSSGAGTCLCAKGWEGVACSSQSCTQGCVNGRCLNGTCACALGWKGVNCSSNMCPSNCSFSLGQGECRPGVGCVCKKGVTGKDCSVAPKKAKAPPIPCPNNCHGRGTCTKGVCRCASPWVGLSCASRPHSLEECSVCCGSRCAAKCKPVVANTLGTAGTCINDCTTPCMGPCLLGNSSAVNQQCMQDLDTALANPASLPADLALLAKTLAARMHSEQDGVMTATDAVTQLSQTSAATSA